MENFAIGFIEGVIFSFAVFLAFCFTGWGRGFLRRQINEFGKLSRVDPPRGNELSK